MNRTFTTIALLIFSANGFSQAGILDPAFGNGGKVFTNIQNYNGLTELASSVAIQADGKVVVAGAGGNSNSTIVMRFNMDGSSDISFDGDGIAYIAGISTSAMAIQNDGKIVLAGSRYSNISLNDIALARLTINGGLDPVFDGNGKLVTVVSTQDDWASSIAIQSDGKIVVGGAGIIGANYDFVLARYNADGSLDEDFDGDGKLITSFGSSDDLTASIALQTDGKIVVGGYSHISGANYDFALARYNTNGSLDASFDGDGKLTTAIGSSYDAISSIAIQNDGKIVAGGNSYGSYYDFALARYNTNGSLDASFDSDGKLTTSMSIYHDAIVSIVIQSDDKIVTSGYGNNGSNNFFALARFNMNGSLDVSFDSDGKLASSIGGLIRSIAIQNDGKLVVAGQSGNDFALARYNTDGSPDGGFDGDGNLVIAINSSNEYAESMAIQNDGKIVVAGYSGVNYDFALARYNTNGSLDASFDADGKTITSIGTSHDYISSIAIQSDGKIIAGGYANIGGNNNFALARYNTDGSLDDGFDGDGKVTTSFGAGYGVARATAIQSDGKILLAGNSYTGSSVDFAVARYNTDGSLDAGFDGDGKLTSPIGPDSDEATSMAIQTDGKIVVAGQVFTGSNWDFALARYNTNGTPDLSFGTGGKVVTSITTSEDLVRSIAIQADGKIILAGRTLNGGSYDFALARYNANGSLDNSFDGDGKLITAIGSGLDEATSVVIQNDGKIMAGGTSFNGNNNDFVLVRYNTDGSLDAGFNSDGKKSIEFFSEGNEEAYALKLYSDRIYLAGNVFTEGGRDFGLVSLLNDAFPLPLSLLEFKGRLINSSSLLTWKTTDEENTHSFDIERSTDGRTYITIGNIAAVNQPGVHQYHFTDNDITSLSASVIYYRLKQTDIDGRFTYSKIIALPIDYKKHIVLFYPNPVSNDANLTITIDGPEQVCSRIIDNAGKIVRQQQWNLSSGSTSLSIDIKRLANGMYYLELKGETINERKPFIKQ
ncbi:T9SS type A sorting domain-containing protein [Terrimonas pollutisoli]|uniref:T9SS type A sorting domain-containing protein n=1 Tax=Terrimonas pollutisoli TaxID=3034147 RepID=UPI0023EC018A|nr:T9SS type A sorting domain-containing protein [Terrimonas sp. H1YJ31]